MQIQTQTALAVAPAVNDNVIAGNQFEFSPVRAILEFGIVAAAVGVEIDVLIGSEAVITRMLPSQANRVAVYPDDFTLKAGVMPGQRIIIRARNTTAGIINLFTTVKFNPV